MMLDRFAACRPAGSAGRTSFRTFGRAAPRAALIALLLAGVVAAQVQPEDVGEGPIPIDIEESVPGRARAPTSSARLSYFGMRYDAFRYLFARRAATPGSIDEFLAAPDVELQNWVVVIVGHTNPLPKGTEEVMGKLSPLHRNGGGVLVATDSSSTAFALLGMEFREGPIEVPAEAGYQGRSSMPKVTNLGPDELGLFKGVGTIVPNRAGYLRPVPFNVPWTAETKAVYPFNATEPPPEESTTGSPAHLVRGRLLASRGRFVWIADQSLFLNEMIEEEDNLPFANNVVDFLIQGRTGVKVLFLEDGAPVSEWIDPRFESGDWPVTEHEMFAQLFDDLIKGMEDGSLIDAAIDGFQGLIPPVLNRRLLVLMPTFAIGLALLFRWTGRGNALRPGRLDDRGTGSPEAAVGAASTTVLTPETAARMLLRQFFRKLSPAAAFVGPPPPLPAAARRLGWWSRRRARSEWARLWTVAVACPKGMNGARLTALARRVAALARQLG
jgi:hypothetical protein